MERKKIEMPNKLLNYRIGYHYIEKHEKDEIITTEL